MTVTTGLAPTTFDPPLVNPSPNGLFGVTQWTEETGPLRWLASGIDIEVFNYGGGIQFGVWTADWCAAESDLDPDDVKDGDRPDFPDTFLALTTWAVDKCDLLDRTRAEVRVRAQQVHRLQEPNQVETTFAARLLADAGTPVAVPGLVSAVSRLEAALAKTNTVGLIHASAALAAPASQANLVRNVGGKLVSPLGHTWVFGGGYVDALGTTLVATSPLFGWRGPVVPRDAPSMEVNEFVAVAERSLVVGYEALIGAVSLGDVSGGFPGDDNYPGTDNLPVGV